jgi:hypothetical protein
MPPDPKNKRGLIPKNKKGQSPFLRGCLLFLWAKPLFLEIIWGEKCLFQNFYIVKNQ